MEVRPRIGITVVLPWSGITEMTVEWHYGGTTVEWYYDGPVVEWNDDDMAVE